MSNSSDGPTSDSFDEALAAASTSPDWQERVNAVRLLAGQADDPRAFDELTRRLDDPDTAVIEAAVEALVRGAGTAGLREVLQALALGEENDNAGYYIRDTLAEMSFDGFPLTAPVRALLEDATSAAVREGAAEMIDLLERSGT